MQLIAPFFYSDKLLTAMR